MAGRPAGALGAGYKVGRWEVTVGVISRIIAWDTMAGLRWVMSGRPGFALPVEQLWLLEELHVAKLEPWL